MRRSGTKTLLGPIFGMKESAKDSEAAEEEGRLDPDRPARRPGIRIYVYAERILVPLPRLPRGAAACRHVR